MTSSKNIDVKIEDLPGSKVQLVGSLKEEMLAEARTEAVKQVQKEAELPGFRKGNVPEKELVKRYGEQFFLEESARIALDRVYPSLIEKNKIRAIGRPSVTFTKLAQGNPVEFTITVPVLPVVTLPDYKSAAKKIERETPHEPTEKEIEDVIREVRERKAHAEIHAKNKPHDHAEKIPEEKLPVFDDAFVQSVGPFKDVADFREKVKENLIKEKQIGAEEKWRTALFDALVEKTDIDLPEVLVESELEKMLAQFKDEINRSGIPYEEYLKHLKKTDEDIRKEWRETAVKKAKLQLILNAISEKEKIEPDTETVQKETEKLLVMYVDADPIRARLYVAQMLLNQEVIKFLDSLSPTK